MSPSVYCFMVSFSHLATIFLLILFLLATSTNFFRVLMAPFQARPGFGLKLRLLYPSTSRAKVRHSQHPKQGRFLPRIVAPTFFGRFDLTSARRSFCSA